MFHLFYFFNICSSILFNLKSHMYSINTISINNVYLVCIILLCYISILQDLLTLWELIVVKANRYIIMYTKIKALLVLFNMVFHMTSLTFTFLYNHWQTAISSQTTPVCTILSHTPMYVCMRWLITHVSHNSGSIDQWE